MFELMSTILKYIFVTIIYFFLFKIIRLIYLDIKSVNSRTAGMSENAPYLKLINRRDELYFKVEESYMILGKKIIGRSAKADIAIEDPFLSSEHAELYAAGGGIFLKDLGSKNGTRVNGVSVTDGVELMNGDKIDVGQLSFLFVKSSISLAKDRGEI